jgi:micrococcal nuclease
VLLAAIALHAEGFTGKVVSITDGDTIRVMRDGVSVPVRLWGVDCPEAKQPFGTRAKQFTGDLAFQRNRHRPGPRYRPL